MANVLEYLNVFKLLGVQIPELFGTFTSGILTGTLGLKLADKYFISKVLKRGFPERICMSFEKDVNSSCFWILRKAETFNSLLEKYKEKFPSSGKMIEETIISSMERIQKRVNDTASQVIAIIRS